MGLKEAGPQARPFTFPKAALQRRHEAPPRAHTKALPELRSENRSHAERTQAVAKGRRSDPAPDGRAPQDKRRACRVFGERETITECDRDCALLEIQSAMNLRHAAALATYMRHLRDTRARTELHPMRSWQR